jgi:hypothetical protein
MLKCTTQQKLNRITAAGYTIINIFKELIAILTFSRLSFPFRGTGGMNCTLRPVLQVQFVFLVGLYEHRQDTCDYAEKGNTLN